MQQVEGVIAVDVWLLYRSDDEEPALNTTLVVALPQIGADGSVLAAELLILDPGPLDYLGVMS